MNYNIWQWIGLTTLSEKPVAEIKDMMRIVLKRIAESEFGTFGVLLHRGIPFAITLEEPWKNNERNISRIPPGQYVCVRVISPKFGNTFEVSNVINRSHILFHAGNTIEDTQGCILVAEEFAERPDGRPWVVSSRRGFNEFLAKLNGFNEFELIIREVI